jgi:hypothetical protein
MSGSIKKVADKTYILSLPNRTGTIATQEWINDGG